MSADDFDLDTLRDELAEFGEPDKPVGRSAREERIIAGFEDIVRFVNENGRAPAHGEEKDIFERLYAVRLEQIRALPEAAELLSEIDSAGLLNGSMTAAAVSEDFELDELRSELAEVTVEAGSIAELRYVRPALEKKAADEVASRTTCADFGTYKPLFDAVQRDLDDGVRQTRRFERKSEIAKGRHYILGGQKAYIADMDEPQPNDHGTFDARLRVIFDNGTESNLLMRSLQKALQQDETGRRILDPHAGPLFSDEPTAAGDETGTIYVLSSESDHPLVSQHSGLVHKIGVTGGSIKTRISNAKHDATYLLADVKVEAEYELYNIDRVRLEKLLHRFFYAARFDIEIKDRFGHPVRPQEWFLVPLQVIDQAVELVRQGELASYKYDPQSASIERVEHG